MDARAVLRARHASAPATYGGVCESLCPCVCVWHHVYASLAPLSYGQHVTFTNNKDNEKYTGERLALRANRHFFSAAAVAVALVALVLT